MRENIAIAVFLAFLLVAACVLFLPLYFAFAYNPFCLLLFCFTWLPALMIGKLGALLADAIHPGQF